eukprot:7373389-Pyramimonas_sp.AAC.1
MATMRGIFGIARAARYELTCCIVCELPVPFGCTVSEASPNLTAHQVPTCDGIRSRVRFQVESVV